MWYEKILTKLMHQYWRFARPMTLGVRAIVEDDEKHIFLVKHTYVRGWHLPGGGVETGETISEAIKKELVEEGNITVDADPRLLAFYKNQRVSNRDHVALFYVDKYRQDSLPRPNREIAQTGWFSPDELPPGTTPATRRRIVEFSTNAPQDHYW